MSYVDLRPDEVRPVRVLVNGQWWDGDLEAYRRDRDGAWRGYVRWSEGLAATKLGWFGEQELASPVAMDGWLPTWRASEPPDSP